MQTYDNTVVPGEDSKFVQSRYQIPTRSDIASNKDSKGEDRKGVH